MVIFFRVLDQNIYENYLLGENIKVEYMSLEIRHFFVRQDTAIRNGGKFKGVAGSPYVIWYHEIDVLRLQPFTTKSEFSPLLTFSIWLRLVVMLLLLLLLLLPVPLPDELQRPPQAERPEDKPGEDVAGQVVHVLSGQIRDLRK